MARIGGRASPDDKIMGLCLRGARRRAGAAHLDMCDLPRHLDLMCALARVRASRWLAVAVVAAAAASSSGCSLVTNKVGNALASGNSVYATDDDPQLVWEAVPF